MEQTKNHKLILLISIVSFLPNRSTPSNSTACPMDLSYVTTFPWNHTRCSPSYTRYNPTECCQTLVSVIGIGFSARLQSTSHFRLPNISSSSACLSSLQTRLDFLNLTSNIVATCFPDPERFVITPSYCAGITTLQDWNSKFGSNYVLKYACGGNLSDTSRCKLCASAARMISSELTALDGNESHAIKCFYLTVVYVAAISNPDSLNNPRYAPCVFQIDSTLPPIRDTPHKKSNAVDLAAYSAAGVAFLLLVVCIVMFYLRRKRKRMNLGLEMETMDRVQLRPNTGSIWFDFKDLEKATGNFSQSNLIGKGGFGIVYKGVLGDGSEVAVKKVLESDLHDDEFKNEVEIISKLRHRNLVPLRGYCKTNEVLEEGCQQFLVYDYMPNGSLDDHIFMADGRKRKPLTWPQRKSIILNVANGLAYLHYGIKPAIFHRDIKANNILLDGDMKAKLADFGLVRQSREGESYQMTRVAGTHGYLAPEYAIYGQLTERADVYSFGVVVLEIMSGRKALSVSPKNGKAAITDWVWTLYKAGRIEEVYDENILVDDEGKRDPRRIMERFVMVGILCAHPTCILRPSISEALKMLEGDIDVPDIPERPLHGPGMSNMDGYSFGTSFPDSGSGLSSRDMLM